MHLFLVAYCFCVGELTDVEVSPVRGSRDWNQDSDDSRALQESYDDDSEEGLQHVFFFG